MTSGSDKAKARELLQCVLDWYANPNAKTQTPPVDAIASALSTARLEERARGWIRCSERMPEGEPRYVLAWCREEQARSVWFIPRVEALICIGPANTPATHWQEMPEPPALPGASDA